MKHFAKINNEFVKYAIGAWWFKRTPQFHEKYLKDHESEAPKSISQIRSIPKPPLLVIDVSKVRFQNVIEQGKKLKCALTNLCKDVSPFQSKILEKNISDLQIQLNADINTYVNKTMSNFGRFGSKLVTLSRLTRRRDPKKADWQLKVGKLFEEGSKRFNYIKQHFSPKINLLDGLPHTSGELNLNEAVVKNKQELKCAIEKWLKTTKSIANCDDYLEKLGKFDIKFL